MEASAGLTCVAVYRRSVRASLERVWENVLDWEHLPWLHAETFAAIEAEDSGSWGWRARVALQPKSARQDFLLELLVEREARRYVARTLEGVGKGTEIWTQLDVAGPQCTTVEVEFHVPGVDARSAEALGAAYRTLYARLWDEDEAMMMRRSDEIARQRASPPGPESLDLGRLEALRTHLPRCVELGGRAWRVVEQGGELLAHAAVCPHRLGPLGEGEIRDGVVTCPWHGYRFDVRSGESADGRGLRLAAAPRVRVDPGTGAVSLSFRKH